MNRGKIIKKREDLYTIRIKIGGKLYEYEAPSKDEAEKLLKKLVKDNPDL